MSEESVITVAMSLVALILISSLGYNAYTHHLVYKEIQAGTPAMVAACAHNTQPNGFDCRTYPK